MTEPSPTWTIVGGMRAPAMVHGFARAPLVVRRGDEMIITRALDQEMLDGTLDDTLDNRPAGERLTVQEWLAYVGDSSADDSDSSSSSDEAFALRQPQPGFAHAGLWILGSAFDSGVSAGFREQARADLEHRGAYRTHEVHGDAWVVLVDESRAAGLRDAWADRAFQAAWDHAVGRDFDAGVRSAQLAVELLPRVVSRNWAMLCVACELSGDKVAAEDYLAVVRNSRGVMILEEIIETKERFVRELREVAFGLVREPNSTRRS